MFKFVKKFSRRERISLGITLFLLFGIGGGLLLAQTSQEIRKKAAETSLLEKKINFDISGEFSDNFPLNTNDPIYYFSVDGDIELKTKKSFLKIVLTDKNNKEYLVYETYPLIADGSSFSFSDSCEETCILDGVYPVSYKVEGYKTTYKIKKTSVIDKFELLSSTVKTYGIPYEQKRLKEEKEKLKIQKLNEEIKKKGGGWVAGETSVSRLSYEEKKKLVGIKSGPFKIPNFGGLEYYKSGVFEFPSEKEIKQSVTASSFVSSFDYRNWHGVNWIPPVKDQGGCASCWAFSSLGIVESGINLYYNQRLNIDLSEQSLVCRASGSCTYGLSLFTAFEFIRNEGVVDESCYPYTANESCPGSFCDWDLRNWRIDNYRAVETDDMTVKRSLIEKGPITFGISSMNHAMDLIGYEDYGIPVWKMKNSWGEGWGEGGFGNFTVPQEDRYFIMYIERPFFFHYQDLYQIRCEDRDNDRYCNWGIGLGKPSTCPYVCKEEKDCDDSNPNLGPYDTNFDCSPVAAIPTVTPTPCVNPPPPILYSPRDGVSFPSGSILDYFIIPISNRCGVGNPEYQINFLFRGRSYLGQWNGSSWLSTGPYNFPGIVVWKARSRYYDSLYNTYRESPWSAEWAYNIIGTISPTPTKFPTNTPTPTMTYTPTPTKKITPTPTPAFVTWVIKSELVCGNGEVPKEAEKTHLYYALWPPNPLTWHFDNFNFGDHVQTITSPYSNNGVYVGLETEKEIILQPFGTPSSRSIRYERFFNPPTWMAMWYGNKLPSGTYIIPFLVPDSWCL